MRDGFPRLRLPLPERDGVCPSLRPAADAPETDGCSPLSGSLTCLSIAPRGTITAQGALLIFVGQTLPAQSAFAKFFLRHAGMPKFRRQPVIDACGICVGKRNFPKIYLHPPIFCL
ncbi:MAG: hypothetical protein AAAC47_09220 [Pararhizobium sp.]